MSLVRVQVAVSLDGFIADAQGGVAWLDPFDAPDLKFEDFFAEIGEIVMGRTTFDQVLGWGTWPYAGTPVTVITHRPLGAAPEGVEPFTGDPAALISALRARTQRDIWLVGGGRSIEAFRAAGLIDRWELAIIPVLLGDGIPLFPRGPSRLGALRLTRHRALSNGIAELWYEPAR